MEFEAYDGYYWQGQKVRLRPMHVEDARQKWKERTDSEARRLLECELELPVISFEAYMEGFEEVCDFKDTTHFTSFGIDTLAGEYVGWLNLYGLDYRNGTFSFGMGIFREYRQKGYAEEALRMILRYGFYELRMQKCHSACLDTNVGSIRLHQKIGFQQEGRRRCMFYINGEYHDELLFGLLKDEFAVNERQAAAVK